jgi:hypothetical protein
MSIEDTIGMFALLESSPDWKVMEGADSESVAKLKQSMNTIRLILAEKQAERVRERITETENLRDAMGDVLGPELKGNFDAVLDALRDKEHDLSLTVAEAVGDVVICSPVSLKVTDPDALMEKTPCGGPRDSVEGFVYILFKWMERMEYTKSTISRVVQVIRNNLDDSDISVHYES